MKPSMPSTARGSRDEPSAWSGRGSRGETRGGTRGGVGVDPGIPRQED